MANLTISPTCVKVLQVIKMGVPVTPSEINAHVGDGDYASKHVWYLRKLGFEFTIQKDGRKVSSYVLISEPENAEAIRNTVHGAKKPKAVKTKTVIAKAKKVSKAIGQTMAEIKEIRDEIAAEKAIEIKAKNLETMKKVAAKFKAAKAPKKVSKKKVREFDDVTEQFGTSGEVGTSFSVERDWDSVEGLDLSKLL